MANDLPIHIHVSETSGEVSRCREQHNGMTPVEYLDSLGILTDPADDLEHRLGLPLHVDDLAAGKAVEDHPRRVHRADVRHILIEMMDLGGHLDFLGETILLVDGVLPFPPLAADIVDGILDHHVHRLPGRIGENVAGLLPVRIEDVLGEAPAAAAVDFLRQLGRELGLLFTASFHHGEMVRTVSCDHPFRSGGLPLLRKKEGRKQEKEGKKGVFHIVKQLYIVC